MDSKSNDVICSKSFTDINIDLGSKRIRHCCKAQDENYTELNWYQINNTPGVVRRRNESIKGIKNSQCAYCWKSNSAYKNIHNEHIKISNNWDQLVNFVEIKFDNVCDLSCLYCNENDSSTIAKELNLSSPVLKYNENDVDLISEYVINIANKREVKVNMLGGEPTLSRGYHKFIQNLILEQPNTKNIFLITTSNGNMSNNVLKKLNSYMEQTKWHWVWGFSGESTGDVFENVRFGADWNRWKNNVEYFANNKNVAFLSFNPTVNLLTLKTFPEYIEYVSNIHKPFFLNGNYVLMPDVMSIQRAPTTFKRYILDAKNKFNSNYCLNKESVFSWFENLESLVGKQDYDIENLQTFLQDLNIQKHNKLNVDLLMDQLNVL